MLSRRRAILGLMRRARRFRSDRRGVSAVEFALIAPLLLLLLGGSLELSGAITASNRATYVADAIGEIVSRTDTTTTPLTQADLRNIAVLGALVDPDIVSHAKRSGLEIENAFKATISSVKFAPKTNLVCALLGVCTIEARVVFSYTLNGTARPCGRALDKSAGKSESPEALPEDLFRSGSLIVVDIETQYRPVTITNKVWTAPVLSFKRTAFFRPRYVDVVRSDTNCSGTST